MYKIKYKVSAFLLSAFVVFGTVSCQYLTVQAFDWVSPTVYLPFDGAIPYLMGLLGVAPSENSLFTEEEYKEYLLDNGYTEEDLEDENGKYADWVDDICNGALNQASEFWLKFKGWVKSKISTSSSFVSMSYSDTINALNYSFALDIPINSSYENFNVYGIAIKQNINNKGMSIFLYTSNNFDYSNYFILNGSSLGSSPVNDTIIIQINSNTGLFASSSISGAAQSFSSVGEIYNIIVSSNLVNSVLSNFSYTVINFGGTSNNVYNQELIDSLSLALSNAVSSAIPDVIPLPWDQIGDTVNEITDTIDSLIEQVNTGVISISAYMQAILDLIGAIAVDTTTNLVYPTNPDKPDETIDDKTEANRENQGFTLWGLEKVFPFCIPFDLYAFMTLLVAEPVAPVINWPVYNPITQDNEIITIDFSTWESVVVLFRYIFDFLFIIGLLLMARALIGGGDSA